MNSFSKKEKTIKQNKKTATKLILAASILSETSQTETDDTSAAIILAMRAIN